MSDNRQSRRRSLSASWTLLVLGWRGRPMLTRQELPLEQEPNQSPGAGVAIKVGLVSWGEMCLGTN